MRYPAFLPVILSGVLLAGCAATTGTRNRTATTTVPAGPVSTASASATTIPASTTVVIRANETISAETAAQGTTYDAEVAQDIVNTNGDLLIPKGSNAKLTVVDATTGGTVGTSGLQLALSSVTANGRTYTVQSNVEEREGAEGLGANERTARNVGGGAALGAVIGAIAGGGSGAAAGAAVGAAAGGTAQVLTRGEAVRVPAESVLTFRLDQPITLR